MSVIREPGIALSDRYKIEAPIGAGGMATVYRARDLKHDRSVALKILKPELGAVLGVDRFLAEIRVTANLQHPNLLPLFDSGEVDGSLYYVMPFVDGESLRAKLTREKQLSVDEAVHIATAIAAALEYAHGKGVIHRDLKPENILIHAGEPVVADFGIALAVSHAGGPRVTQTGISLGTPQYMSPEQATGDRTIDRRADIYALGAVLYEMLTGEPPHTGPTVQAIIARVLTDRAKPVRLSRPAVPEHVEAAVDRALEKLPADRWSSAREFAEALAGRLPVGRPPSLTGATLQTRRTATNVRVPLLALLVVAIALATVAAVGWWRAKNSLLAVTAVALALPPDVQLGIPWDFPVALSPDGRTVVFVGRTGLTKQLYVKRPDDAQARPLAGTEGAHSPVFSPDGSALAFISHGQLRRIPVAGGGSIEIQSGRVAADGWPPLTLAWTDDGRILVTPNGNSGLPSVVHAVPAQGGAPVATTRLDSAAKETQQRWPVVLDDGETVLYTSYPAGNDMSKARIAIAWLKSGRSRRLDVSGIRALGLIDDHLVFVTKEGAIRALRVDLRQGRVSGAPITLVEGVKVAGGGPVAAALSPSGTLTYLSGNTHDQQLLLADRTGAHRTVADHADFDVVRASPSGRFIAVDIDRDTISDVWIFDRDAGTLSRLEAKASRYDPSWSPDNRWVYYEAYGDAADSLFRRPADGGGSEALVALLPSGSYTLDPTARILLHAQRSGKSRSIRVRNIDGDTTSRPLSGSTGEEAEFRFSPDGRWLAISSNQSGVPQVYVRPFAAPGPRLQVSTTRGREPVWSPDGKELYYRDDQYFVAAELDLSGTPVVKRRTNLFPDEYESWGEPAGYDVTRDGRFVLVSHGDERDRLIVITNWREQVRHRLRDAR